MALEHDSLRTSQSAEFQETLREKPHLAIAGASGRIGRRLLIHMAEKYQITPLQHQTAIAFQESINSPIEDFDITNPDKVKRTVDKLATNGILTLINSTGVLTTDASEVERGDTKSPMYQVHVEGARNLAKACREYEIVLIHPSSEYVFNGRKPIGEKYTENDPIDKDTASNPTWYGLTKAWGEQAVLDEYPEGTIVLRVSQVQSPAGGLFVASLRALEQNQPFTRADNQMVSAITDATLSQAIMAIERIATIQKIDSIYQVAPTNAYSSYRTCIMLAETYGLSEKAKEMMTPTTLERLVETGEQKVVRPKNAVLDVSKFQRDFPDILHSVEDEIVKFKNLYGML